VAGAVVALLAGGYVAALDTSMFAVRKLEIVGGSGHVEAELRAALAPELGRSLLRIGAAEIGRRVATLPDVVGVRYDREFPHTLRVVVTPERPVLLLRRGASTWLVSARGRVLRELRSPRRSPLPRLYVPAGTPVVPGETLGPFDGRIAAAALAPLSPRSFPSPVRFVRASRSELTLVLRSGLEIRFGDLGDLYLKLAIARRILHAVAAGPTSAGYLDVSVPERPVLRLLNPRVSG
jgi:cell division protein FtsQ